MFLFFLVVLSVLATLLLMSPIQYFFERCLDSNLESCRRLPIARYSMAYVQYEYNTYIFSTSHLPKVQSFFFANMCHSTFETSKPPSVKAARVFFCYFRNYTDHQTTEQARQDKVSTIQSKNLMFVVTAFAHSWDLYPSNV